MQERFKIKQSILRAAKKCPFNFACLSDVKAACKPVANINGRILMVKNAKKNCSYRLGFGVRIICKCPVRIAIYQDYGQ